MRTTHVQPSIPRLTVEQPLTFAVHARPAFDKHWSRVTGALPKDKAQLIAARYRAAGYFTVVVCDDDEVG